MRVRSFCRSRVRASVIRRRCQQPSHPGSVSVSRIRPIHQGVCHSALSANSFAFWGSALWYRNTLMCHTAGALCSGLACLVDLDGNERLRMKIEYIRKIFLPCLAGLVSIPVALAAETMQWRLDAVRLPASSNIPVAPPPPPMQPRFRPVPVATWQPFRPTMPYPGQFFVSMGLPPSSSPPVAPAFARQYAWRPATPPLIVPRRPPAPPPVPQYRLSRQPRAWMPSGAAWAQGYRFAPPPPPRYRLLPPPRPAFPVAGQVPLVPYGYPPLGYYPYPYSGRGFRRALGQSYPMPFRSGPYFQPGPLPTLMPWGVMPAGNGWSDPYFTRRWSGTGYRRFGAGGRRSSWGSFLPGWMPLAGTPWAGDCSWCGS